MRQEGIYVFYHVFLFFSHDYFFFVECKLTKSFLFYALFARSLDFKPLNADGEYIRHLTGCVFPPPSIVKILKNAPGVLERGQGFVTKCNTKLYI